MTVYNKAAFDAAHTKFLEAPTTLTDDDIAQFAAVLPKLGDRARARQQNLVAAETADERKLLDSRATRRDMMQGFEDVIFPLLAVHQYKRDQLEAQIVQLGRQVEDLKSEVNYLTWARQETAK